MTICAYKMLVVGLMICQAGLAISDESEPRSITFLTHHHPKPSQSNRIKINNDVDDSLHATDSMQFKWTQRIADSEYTVILEPGEEIIGTAMNKNVTFMEFVVDTDDDNRESDNLKSATVFQNYFPERLVYLKGSMAFNGNKI